MLSLAKFSEIMAAVYTEKAPHKLCQFIYEVSNAFNGFYHDTKILAERLYCVNLSDKSRIRAVYRTAGN